MITQETKLKINNGTYTMESFMEKYKVPTMDEAILIANVLVKQGKAVIVSKISDEQQLIIDAIAREDKNNVVNAINQEEEEHKAFLREQSTIDNDLVKISLNFATTHEALTAENWINNLGIEDTELKVKKGVVSLIISDITPQEYSKIARQYQTEKAIKTTVDMTSKVFNNTTDAVNYGLTKVVAPTAKIVGEAGMNLGKGLIHTTAKVGSGLINSGAKAVTDTKFALETDPEMLRASKELRDAKDTMKSFFKSKLAQSKKRSGINIL